MAPKVFAVAVDESRLTVSKPFMVTAPPLPESASLLVLIFKTSVVAKPVSLTTSAPAEAVPNSSVFVPAPKVTVPAFAQLQVLLT
jgi:hypothetical protein